MSKVNWHALKIKEVFKEVGANKNGLSIKEVRERRVKYGANILPEDKRPSVISVFARQLRSPMVSVLLTAAVITAALGEFIDMGVILAAVIVNAIIGFWQEWQADRAFASLKKMIKHQTRARRDGREIMMSASELVPGDIMLLNAGDRIPADGRIIEMYDLEVNEATLTGESLFVKKQIKPLLPATMLAERANMVFQGTTVARGKAEAVVVAIGKDTAFGEIALLARGVEDPKTPLQEQLNKLSQLLGSIIMVITAGIFVIGALQGRPLTEMFLIAVAIAVAAIPEGLLISLTVILAIGMRNLAKRNAVVRRLLAAETLGSVSVICTDKTGTITTGEMEVVEVVGDEKKAWEIAVAGNSTTNPTSSALMSGAIKAGSDPAQINRLLPKIDEIPFDSSRKWAATLHRGQEHNVLYIRGAPEKLLEVSKLKTSEYGLWLKKIDQLTAQGKRLVAVAYFEVPRKKKKLDEIIKNHILPQDITFVGILALQDPLRPHIQEVVTGITAAGIRTIMITGDHAKTAAVIGAEAGVRGKVITGADIDAMDDELLAQSARDASIFARVLPSHKVRIISAFHRLGASVAMTGDGVNDAPALKAADIGVAVGSGTDVAKEAADVVLLDNNLKTIVGAVEGGRNIYENVKKVVAYLLSDSWTEIIIVVGSLLLGLPLPVLAAQILWINLIEDSFPNMALAFDPGEPYVMQEKPRLRKASLIDREMKALVFGVGITTSVLLFGLYWYLMAREVDLAYIRTMIFVGLGINSLFYIYSIRSLRRFIWQVNPFNNKFLLASTLFSVFMLMGAVYVPLLQSILRTVPLAASDWLPLIGLGVINIALIEFVKAIFIVCRRNHQKCDIIKKYV